MKIKIACLEDAVIAVGFRKMMSYTKAFHPDTTGYMISLANYLSPVRAILGTYGETEDLNELTQDTIRDMAEPLAKAEKNLQ